MDQIKGIRRKLSRVKEPNSYELNPSEPVFTAQYLGKANVVELINPSNGYSLASKYTEQLLKEKKSGQKPYKIELLISKNISRGLTLTDTAGKMPEQTFQLQRIAFCTALRHHTNIFTFIAEQAGNLECHAFRCSKTEKASAICVAITRAFTVAHKEWAKKRARIISKKERNAVVADIAITKGPQQESKRPIHQGRNFDDIYEELKSGDDLDEYENCPDVMMYVRGERTASEVTDTSID